MKALDTALIATLILTSRLCLAHAHLVRSTPAEGAVITASPKQLELNLSEPARLTAASIRRGTEKPRPLPFASTPATQRIVLELPALQPGSYTFQYRVISADTHVASGSVHFTVTAQAAR
jgi:methionine-rich copper-binding protein CopC